MKPGSELFSLLYLLEDPDPVIKKAVKGRFLQHGEEVVEQLEFIILESDNNRDYFKYRGTAEEIILEITYNSIAKLLKEPQPDLEKILFLLTKIADPLSNETLFRGTINIITSEIGFEISENRTPIENIEIFNYYFFIKERFKVIHTQEPITTEVLMDRVLLNRGGAITSLSLAYFLLASKVGLPIYPLYFSEGFIPAYIDNRGEPLFYINIGDVGKIFGAKELLSVLKNNKIENVKFPLEMGEERIMARIYNEVLLYAFSNEGDNNVVARLNKVLELIEGER